MRLIDADALIKKALDEAFFDSAAEDTFCELVETAPTVYAVEVVRCKDCLYCKRSADGAYFCDWRRDMFQVFPSDYCSDGERREL